MNRYQKGMEEIVVSEELEQCILGKVLSLKELRSNEEQKTAWNRKRRRLYRTNPFRILTGSLVVILLVSVLVYISDRPGAHPEGPLQNILQPFVLSVYAADGQPFELQPDVTFLFGDYRLTNSRAPGFGLRADAEGSDEIKIRVSEGSLLQWAPPDYRVNNIGTEMTLKSGDTFYWSPSSGVDMGDIAAKARVTLTAYTKGRETGRAILEISADESGVYNGRLLNNK
ncbi:hypothetical protein [Paenibacillus sp. sgz500958]|uniref:hypothetical protein n=1 Tax=Paenibacillus sp. sgz500958 TaxID=3242475 RepID=UPI0036D2D2CE